MKRKTLCLVLMFVILNMITLPRCISASARVVVLETVEQEGKITAAVKSLIRSSMIKALSDLWNFEVVADKTSWSSNPHGLISADQMRYITTEQGGRYLIIPWVARLANSKVMITARLWDAENNKLSTFSSKIVDNNAMDIQIACREAINDVFNGEKQKSIPVYAGNITILPENSVTNQSVGKIVSNSEKKNVSGEFSIPNMSVYVSDVDVNIPKGVGGQNKNTFVLIISNENYTALAKVPYALKDGEIFEKYCNQTLGIPKENIRHVKDATYGGMLNGVDQIHNISRVFEPNTISVIVYYAGHGAPDERTKDAYLLPVDAFSVNPKVCYSLKDLYGELARMQAKRVIVFVDACFSGSARAANGEMLASARGVAIKSNIETLDGNLVVFSATNGSETALPYERQQHGLFTYFLLKKLQETKGDVRLQNLIEYVETNVKQQSAIMNNKLQTPTLNIAADAVGWESWKLNQ